MSLPHGLLDWLSSAVWINALLATLVAAFIALAARHVRSHGARHTLWLFVLLQLLVPPVLEWAVLPSWTMTSPRLATVEMPAPASHRRSERTESDGVGMAGPVLVAEPSGATPGQPVDPDRLLFTLASLGTLVILLLSAVRVARLERLARAGAAPTSRLASRVASLAGDLGLARAPDVSVVDACLPPMIWAPWPNRPRLILPRTLLKRLDAAELDAVLLHELAHIARRDHLVRIAEMATTMLYWWHPVLWLARRALRRSEERACDARTVGARPDLAGAYARGLLTTLDFLRRGGAPRTVLATASDPRNDLEERLTMILRHSTSSLPPSPIHLFLRRGLIALGVLALLVVPVQAGSNDADDDESATELRSRMKRVETEAQALRAQQKNLAVQMEKLENERQTLREAAERMKLEANAMRLEAQDRTEEAQIQREHIEILEAERAAREQRREIERQARSELESLSASLREHERELRGLEENDRAQAAEVLERMRAIEIQRVERAAEVEARVESLEAERAAQAREFLEHAEEVARRIGDTERIERIERRRDAIESEERLRSEKREAREQARMLERQAHDRKRAYAELRLEGRGEEAEALRQRAETEHAALRARLELERHHRDRGRADATMQRRLEGLASKLETLRGRTTSAAEADALEVQIDALHEQLERLKSGG